MDCDACKSVRYCSDKCQQDHLPKHGEMCKKRAAELRDEILFRQPESSHMGDCPICFVPHPLDRETSIMMTCCSTVICRGCSHANKLREREARLQQTCPFCRRHLPKTQEEADLNKMKRVVGNDPVAMRNIGKKHYDNGDYETAFEYLTKAAELGDATAHYHLSLLYREGEGVKKDKEKELYHLEEAAIAGHPRARHNLGCDEGITKGTREQRSISSSLQTLVMTRQYKR
eukprot:scaffold35780_cov80-Skeletonema_marinoi.AAC.2